MPVRAPWRVILDRGHRIDRRGWRGAFALWFFFVSTETLAQISGSASLLSDYRYRGVSLSHNRPAAQLAVNYDNASGWYGGGFASTVQLGYPTGRELQGIAFGGYARRMPSGVSWDVGVDYSAFTGGLGYDYAEVYVGVASEDVSARLYYAPRYFGQDEGVLYGEINASWQLIERVRLLAHAGASWNNSQYAYGRPVDQHVFDASVGVIVDLDQFAVQLSWVGINSLNAPYPVPAPNHKNGVVLLLSWSF